MKKLLLFLFVFLINSSLFALTNGGERPAISPSWFHSVEDEIIEQAKLVNNTYKSVKTANTEKGWFGPSEREKVTQRLTEQKDKLKNLLSSPSKKISKRYEKVIIKDTNTNNEDVKKSNNEIIEIYYALENSISIINIIQNKLKSNKKDYVTAIELYEVYKICLNNIIEMGDEFSANVKTKYSPSIDNHILQIDKQKNEVNKILNSTNVSQTSNKKMLEGTINNLINFLKSLTEAKNKLYKQKEWVDNNLNQLRENLSVLEVTIKTINVTKEKTDIEKTISKDFLNLNYSLPPIIEF